MRRDVRDPARDEERDQHRHPRAVAAVLEVTGNAAEKAGIRVDRDRQIVPAEALLELPALSVTLARAEQAGEGVVVTVCVVDRHPLRELAEIGDPEDDRFVVDVIANLDETG